MAKAVANGDDRSDAPEPARKVTCGIVMPISSVGELSKAHWKEVFLILKDAAEAAGFDAQLVSDADDVGIIQKRIIQNLHDNPIVVCDVSTKNPNVMFELGIRLAFDKPTIIVKDDKTNYIFDTAPIEHLEYPRDLRYHDIIDFKEKLGEKIVATHKSALDPKYTTFLKHFGEFQIASIDKKEVTAQTFIIEEIKEIKELIKSYGGRSLVAKDSEDHNDKPYVFGIPRDRLSNEKIPILEEIVRAEGVEFSYINTDSVRHRFSVDLKGRFDKRLFFQRVSIIVKELEPDDSHNS